MIVDLGRLFLDSRHMLFGQTRRSPRRDTGMVAYVHAGAFSRRHLRLVRICGEHSVDLFLFLLRR